MILKDVYFTPDAEQVLYDLLKERQPWQSINHREMPTFEQHCAFVRSKPHDGWWLIECDGVTVGSVYVTKQHEVGIFIFSVHSGRGHGKWAVNEVRRRYPGIELIAHVSAKNGPSRLFFQSIGAYEDAVTYKLPPL